jgi:hypothetical protein
MRQKFANALSTNVRLVAGVCGLVLSLSTPAWANAIYTYTGNPFTNVQPTYTTADRVTVTMTLTNPLGPNLSASDVTPNLVALSMSDGLQTIDLTTPGLTGTIATFSTDPSGNISLWNVALTLDTGPFGNCCSQIGTENDINPKDGTPIMQDDASAGNPPGSVFEALGSNSNAPGQWSVAPEPNTVALLLVGLVTMAGFTRRHV